MPITKSKAKKRKLQKTKKLKKNNQIGYGQKYNSVITPPELTRVFGVGGYGAVFGLPRLPWFGEIVADIMTRNEVMKVFDSKEDADKEFAAFDLIRTKMTGSPDDYRLLTTKYAIFPIGGVGRVDLSVLGTYPYTNEYFRGARGELVDKIFYEGTKSRALRGVYYGLVYPKGKYSVGDVIDEFTTIHDFYRFLIQMRNVLEGLRLLHRNQLVHGDIKPDNILVYQEELASTTDIPAAAAAAATTADVAGPAGRKGPEEYRIIDFGDVKTFDTIVNSISMKCWMYYPYSPINIFRRGVSDISRDGKNIMLSKYFYPLVANDIGQGFRGYFETNNVYFTGDKYDEAGAIRINKSSFNHIRKLLIIIKRNHPYPSIVNPDLTTRRNTIIHLIDHIINQKLCNITSNLTFTPDYMDNVIGGDLRFINEYKNTHEVKQFLDATNTYLQRIYKKNLPAREILDRMEPEVKSNTKKNSSRLVLNEINSRTDIYSFGITILIAISKLFERIIRGRPDIYNTENLPEILERITHIIYLCCILQPYEDNGELSLRELNLDMISGLYDELVVILSRILGISPYVGLTPPTEPIGAAAAASSSSRVSEPIVARVRTPVAAGAAAAAAGGEEESHYFLPSDFYRDLTEDDGDIDMGRT